MDSYSHTISDVEVLAPAGNWAALHAALQAQADAVYLGVGQLNMRAASNINFQPEELPTIVQTLHEAHCKCYLTLNTIVYDEELPQLAHLLDLAQSAEVDAIIASDQAVISMAHERGLRIHLSTQLSISNAKALAFYSQWADVAVLARELTLQQVAEVQQQIGEQKICGPSGQPMRIELFAHGALCMAISGKCYMSLHEANRSANRGSCAQICRHGYLLTDRMSGRQIEVDNQYLMSPKDLCTLPFLDQVLAAGVSVLKIEGRARSAEYVLEVTKAYKRAVAAIQTHTYTPALVEELMGSVQRVFNRGFWSGYYLGGGVGEWANRYGSQATERKQILGVVTNFFQRSSIAEVRVEAAPLHAGHSLYIIGPTTGVVAAQPEQIWVDEKPAPVAEQGKICTFVTPSRVRRGDKVFLRIAVVGGSG